MSEGKKFWNKIARKIRGTSANNEMLAERFERDRAFVEENLKPLMEKQDQILSVHKKQIFAHMIQLDSRGTRTLDLREIAPELNTLFADAARVEDSGFHLTFAGGAWFAKHTQTQLHTPFVYEGGVVSWLADSPIERGLWGANE